VPANIAPSTAKFFAYDTVRTFISLATSWTVGVSVPVMLGSIPAVKRPNTAPIAPPVEKKQMIPYSPQVYIHSKNSVTEFKR